jgi:hypothetical protein
MDKNAVFLNQNASRTPIVTITTLAPKMFACLIMDSAETLLDVTIAMNVPLTSALLPLTLLLSLVPILQFLALPIQPSSMLTLSCFLMKIKQNGLESATRTKVVFLVSLTLSVMITMDVPLTLANNNTA